jgi:hypothetical protein
MCFRTTLERMSQCRTFLLYFWVTNLQFKVEVARSLTVKLMIISSSTTLTMEALVLLVAFSFLHLSFLSLHLLSYINT